jgi:hypothetical protein
VEYQRLPNEQYDFSEAAGKVEGAWETAGHVYFEELTEPSAAPVSAPGESKGHKHPRIATAPNGDLLMAWIEGTGCQPNGRVDSRHGSVLSLPDLDLE